METLVQPSSMFTGEVRQVPQLTPVDEIKRPELFVEARTYPLTET
jgi:hypothetical protein